MDHLVEKLDPEVAGIPQGKWQKNGLFTDGILQFVLPKDCRQIDFAELHRAASRQDPVGSGVLFTNP